MDNGIAHYGNDEKQCHKSSYPGYFKCKNTSIFLSVNSICDTSPDCPNLDDENFCDLSLIECPVKCNCLLYAVSCNGTSDWQWPDKDLLYHFMEFVDGTFPNSKFPDKVINSLRNIKILKLIDYDLDMFKLVPHSKHNVMQEIDFSLNRISRLLPKSLGNFPNLSIFFCGTK